MPPAPPQHQRAPIMAQHRTRESKAGKTPHPFAGRKGIAIRDRLAATLYVEQSGACAMCGDMINATLRGTRDRRDAVVDHIRPHNLRPDLVHDIANLWLVCRACHGTCHSIEKRLWPDADRIAAEKAAQRGFSVDGWRL